jgi:hypothetical protein
MEPAGSAPRGSPAPAPATRAKHCDRGARLLSGELAGEAALTGSAMHRRVDQRELPPPVRPAPELCVSDSMSLKVFVMNDECMLVDERRLECSSSALRDVVIRALARFFV